MVTKEQLQNLPWHARLHYTGKHDCGKHVGPRGGVSYTCTEVRISGKLQAWKTRPEEFRLPVKYGMYESSAITHYNASDWHVASDCPVEDLRH